MLNYCRPPSPQIQKIFCRPLPHKFRFICRTLRLLLLHLDWLLFLFSDYISQLQLNCEELVCLPNTSYPSMGSEDATAKAISWYWRDITVLLTEYQLLCVLGDGCCLYRATSHGLYGTERHHHCIQLLTACEIAKNRQFYGTSDPHYIDLIKM